MTKRLWIAITVLVWIVALATWRGRCELAWFTWGIDAASCPDGEPRQTAQLEAMALSRGKVGWVQLRAIAHYTTGEADRDRRAPIARVSSVELTLSGPKLPPRELEVESWDHRGGAAIAEVTLPDIPDGDYQLRASYETALGTG